MIITKYVFIFLILIYLGASIGFYIDALSVEDLYKLRKKCFIIPFVTFVMTIYYIFSKSNEKKLSFFKRLFIIFLPHKQFIIGLIISPFLNEDPISTEETTNQQQMTNTAYHTSVLKGLASNKSPKSTNIGMFFKDNILKRINYLFSLENDRQIYFINQARIKKI